jgi:hypothetical protein
LRAGRCDTRCLETAGGSSIRCPDRVVVAQRRPAVTGR